MRLRVVWRASVVASILLCFGRESTAQKVSAKDTPRPALLDQARTFMAANDLEQARATAEQVIAADPTSGEAHDLLGFVLGKQGHTAEAIAEFERAVQLRPTALRRAIPSRRDALVDTRPRRRAAGAHGSGRAPAGSCGGPLLPRADAGRSRPTRASHRRAARGSSVEPVARRRADEAGYGAPDIRRSGWRDRAPGDSGRPRSVFCRCAEQPRDSRCLRKGAATKPSRCCRRSGRRAARLPVRRG